VQEPEGSLLLSCSDDDDSYDVVTHGPSVVTSGEQRESSTGPTSETTTAKRLLELRPFQSKKPADVAITGYSKKGTSKVVLLKHSLTKTSANQTPAQAEWSGDRNSAKVPSKNKIVRPTAWLLHSVGLRMVREKVYDDLIDIQEQKGSEGQLSGNEQRQLERLRSAHFDLVKQNRPYTVRSKRRCRCGFAAGSRLELELHRDLGGMSGEDTRFFFCCLCGIRNIRSPQIMYSHIDRCHGRQPRMHSNPPARYCPYCPYEQRNKATKYTLSRHVLNCALNFRIDRNLAPTASDADIPLFEVANPPALSVQTSAATSNVGALKSSSLLLPEKVANIFSIFSVV